MINNSRNQGDFKIMIFIIPAIFYLCAFSCNSTKTNSAAPDGPVYRKIKAETAYQMMQESKSFVLLDVRSMEEYLDRHIDGAILIPVNELEKRSASELPDKNTLIFVYCRSGGRSANASRALVGQGYTQVYDIGGIMDWPYKTVSGD